jgi:hypothetical protein
MAHRTTIVLDDETRAAAAELAARYRCSPSEAIRRAIVRHRDHVVGVPPEARQERRRTLVRLIELFDGTDAAGEVRRLEAENEDIPGLVTEAPG